MSAEDILTLLPPPADARVVYGKDPNQFGELRFPKTDAKSGNAFPVVMNIHGGFWRAQYDLAHAGHLCAALTGKGYATWNVEYRRVGNPGGGWPGTFEDIASSYRFIPQIAKQYKLDASRILLLGHSAGGQLALCLAAHERSVSRVVSLAGVVDLQQAYQQHLSNNAVASFLGGKPNEVAEHYKEADPMELSIKAKQWLVQGAADEVVPPIFSRGYVEAKQRIHEDAHYLEIGPAGHYDLIDPRSQAWSKVLDTVLRMLPL